MRIKLLRYAEKPANMLKPVKKINSVIFGKTGRHPGSDLKYGSMLKVRWL